MEPLHPLQLQRFRSMTFAEKWAIAQSLLETARVMRLGALRELHPDWSEDALLTALALEWAGART